MSSNWTKLKRKLSHRKSQKEKTEKQMPGTSDSVPVKHHYFRRFFYAFSAFFIVFGMIGIIWFVYHEDPNAFGRAEKYYRRGLEYQQEHHLDKALNSYEKCLRISSSYTDARLQLVQIYQSQGNFERAEKLLDEGLILQPRYEEFYRQKVRLLTEQNRIPEALEYLDNISATYIVVKLNAERPGAITAAPIPGTYTNSVEVTLNIPAETTVYYTTDGSAPDKNSTVYSPGEVIRVDRGSVNIRAFAINENGMPSAEFDATYRVYNNRTEYQFKDAKVEKLVRLVLGKNNGAVYYKDLESVTTLDVTAGAAAGIQGSITTLEDLLEMTNLTYINLDGETGIASFEPLRRMAQLKTLSLNRCGLTDAQFSQLSSVIWLQSLSVQTNELTSLSPITAFTSLRTLNAAGNKIKTVPALSRMSGLTDLNLSGNALTSLTFLNGNTSVKTLNISNNLITDLTPLATCPALSSLDAASNLITSAAPLAGCMRIETLNLSHNDITKLDDLQALSSLMNLNVSGTKITSIDPLARLPQLTALNVSDTEIRDFTIFAGSGLKNLSAANCGISNLTSMVMLSSLEILDVSGNYLTDIGEVALMYQLSVLNLKGNFITDFTALLNCSKLTSVNCSGLKMAEEVRSQLDRKHVTVIQ